MNIKSPTLTRRTFLAAAGAAVAGTAAHAMVNPWLAGSPLKVASLLDGEAALRGLNSLLNMPEFALQAIVVSSITLQQSVSRLLLRRAQSVPVLALPPGLRSRADLADALLIFGPWKASDQKLLPLLRQRLPVYVDDPTLALRLATVMPGRLLPDRSLVGLISLLDPAVEFAGKRIRSGVMGAISDVAVTRRERSPILALEAAAVLNQLAGARSQVALRHVVTRNAPPGIYVCCERGQLQIPLHSSEERRQALPFRLLHFVPVARGEAASAISLHEMAELSQWI
jgi:hypothetical protein